MSDSFIQAIVNFHFVRPWWFLAIVPLVTLFALLWKNKDDQSAWQQIIPSHFLPSLMIGKMNQTKKLPLTLIGIAWLLSVLALAGPTWRQLPEIMEKNLKAKVFILDLSQSMNAEDLTPNRIARAKHKLSDLLKFDPDGMTGLIVYAGAAHVVIPLTDDTKTIEALMSALDPSIMPIPGSNATKAIEEAVNLLTRNGYRYGELFLLTDGIKPTEIEPITSLLNKRQFTLSILGIGTTEGAPIPTTEGAYLKDNAGAIVMPKLNRAALQSLSEQSNGRYAELSADDSDVNFLLFGNAQITLEFANKNASRPSSRKFDLWQEDGYWIAAIVLLLSSLAFRRGWLNCLLLGVLISTPQPSMAGLWDDLWKTTDQQASKALAENNAADAAQLFLSPDWKASAYYKSKQYDKAAEVFRALSTRQEETSQYTRLRTTDTLYNLGNALAHLGQYSDAIAAYDKAIELEPSNLDARHNKTLLQRLLQRHLQQDMNSPNGLTNNNSQSDKNPPSDKNQSLDENQQTAKNSQESTPEQSSPEQSAPGQSPANPSLSNPSSPENDATNSSRLGKDSDDDKRPSDGNLNSKAASTPLETIHLNNASNNQPTNKPTASKRPRLVKNLNPQEQDALRHWLQQVDDDAGGLLRRKFYLQAQELTLENTSIDEQW